jgi:hypothetical protein
MRKNILYLAQAAGISDLCAELLSGSQRGFVGLFRLTQPPHPFQVEAPHPLCDGDDLLVLPRRIESQRLIGMLQAVDIISAFYISTLRQAIAQRHLAVGREQLIRLGQLPAFDKGLRKAVDRVVAPFHQQVRQPLAQIHPDPAQANLLLVFGMGHLSPGAHVQNGLVKL